MTLLKDPIVLICGAIILVGFFALLWAISQLVSKKSARRGLQASGAADDSFPPLDQVDTDFRDPLVSRQEIARPVSAPGSGGPLVNREVADRLETMTQRLAEMQAVLTKQSGSTASGGTAQPGVGQGFSPETIDKLLRIIGNVVQQVDVLQKSLNVPKDGTKTGA
jgi:hypothetical protein